LIEPDCFRESDLPPDFFEYRLPNRSGMPRDLPLPFPPTRAGVYQTA
jgi:hypothetical protein